MKERGVKVKDTPPIYDGKEYQESMHNFLTNQQVQLAPEVRATHESIAKRVFGMMPQPALELIARTNAAYRMFPSLKDMGRDIVENYPFIRSQLSKQGIPDEALLSGRLGGLHYGNMIWGDGHFPFNTLGHGSQYAHQIFAHEHGHLLDYAIWKERGRPLSDNPIWKDTWQQESFLISQYAKSSPAEGLAEAVRLFYCKQIPMSKIKAYLPETFRVFDKEGLVPTRSTRRK